MSRLRLRVVAPLVAVALLLTGCTETGPVGETVIGPTVQQWKQPDTAPIEFSGTTIDGKAFDSRALLGDVVVVNFWYESCPPCRAEAPTLKKLAAEFEGDGVRFVGINTRDDSQTAASFDREFEPGYPSIVDQTGGSSAQLAFSSARGPNATPTTLVLDRKGRVTARMSGLADGSILNTLIQDAVDGKAA